MTQADFDFPGSANQPQQADQLVQSFLNSLSSGSQASQQQGENKPFATLSDLLPASTTTSYISTASLQQIDHLCSFLPPELFLIAQESSAEGSATAVQAALDSLSLDQKKKVLNRVLNSPQLHQSLGSLTIALRDGGLPMIGEALGLKLENGGHIRGGIMPLGGGTAVEAFVKGVKKAAEEEESKKQ